MKTLLISAAAMVLTAGAAHAQQQHAGRGFEAMDADKDGRVSAAEFQKVRGERLAGMFARVDTDKDGRVTAAEAEAAAQGGRGARMLKMLDADGDAVVTQAEVEAGSTAMFARADANKDGAITQDELAAMRRAMGPGAKRGN
jgi:Ca2+-binding EF-hand superfamily protein